MSDAADPAIATAPAEQAAAEDEGTSLSGTVLLVEDSLIIAMHVREMLISLGADEAIVAPSVEEAFVQLDQLRPSCAILDINLGAETSLPVADRLLRDGIPFVFATGYGKQFVIPAQHAAVTIVQKPYNRANLADALLR